MILVDTSILIGYFKNASGIPYDKMDYIIDNDVDFSNIEKIYKNSKQY